MKSRLFLLLSCAVMSVVVVSQSVVQAAPKDQERDERDDDQEGDERDDDQEGDEHDDDVILIPLFGIGPGTGAKGLVVIEEKLRGPDKLELRIEGLPPKERVAVFLTRHADPGRLPAQFIGEFRTNEDGMGKLKLKAEIVSAFASANQTLEDASGVADDGAAGRLPIPLFGSANTIPLNWFRGYFVDIFPHNVFGIDETTAGGAPAFLSALPLP